MHEIFRIQIHFIFKKNEKILEKWKYSIIRSFGYPIIDYQGKNRFFFNFLVFNIKFEFCDLILLKIWIVGCVLKFEKMHFFFNISHRHFGRHF